MQTDPIGYGDGMNMYAYVGGGPENLVDSTGTQEICFTYQTTSYIDNAGSRYWETKTVCTYVPDPPAPIYNPGIDTGTPGDTGGEGGVNAAGRLYEVSKPGAATTRRLYAGSALIAEHNSSGGRARRFSHPPARDGETVTRRTPSFPLRLPAEQRATPVMR